MRVTSETAPAPQGSQFGSSSSKKLHELEPKWLRNPKIRDFVAGNRPVKSPPASTIDRPP
jgi:hypothetical protein